MATCANFYNDLTQSVKITIDAAVGGSLTGKTKEFNKLLEDMSFNNYGFSSERSITKKNP